MPTPRTWWSCSARTRPPPDPRPDLTSTDAPQGLDALRADRAGSVLLFDFDGSLSPIVDDPEAARPGPGIVDALTALAASYQRVAIVSGRPVRFLAEHLPVEVDLSGLYGLESRIDGVVEEAEGVARWRAVVADAAVRARTEGPAGLGVEDKGLSITLHVRTAPEVAPEVDLLAAAIAADTGLEVRPAKMSVELHPPVDADKGTAVLALAGGARGVLYLGDDIGDLPAFAALADLAADGRTVVRAVVAGAELPDRLLAAADLVVPGQAGVRALLEDLARGR